VAPDTRKNAPGFCPDRAPLCASPAPSLGLSSTIRASPALSAVLVLRHRPVVYEYFTSTHRKGATSCTNRVVAYPTWLHLGRRTKVPLTINSTKTTTPNHHAAPIGATNTPRFNRNTHPLLFIHLSKTPPTVPLSVGRRSAGRRRPRARHTINTITNISVHKITAPRLRSPTIYAS
jgi:hypothetical protein